MASVVISGSGLYTPPHQITNQALVAVFNAFAETFNLVNAVALGAG